MAQDAGAGAGAGMILRSLAFNLAFYLNLAGILVVGVPVYLMSRHQVFALAGYWSRSSLWLLRVICRTGVEFRGLDNIPKGALIIAPKHQSIWETFALLPYFDDFTFVLKRELTMIPFFGWYLWRAEQVAINRKQGSSSLSQVTRAAREIAARGRQIFIFPEGTRRPVGAPPQYKFGVAQVYGETGMACLPVALNSGLFWPRRSFLRRPGTVVVEFLPLIAPGLGKSEFLKVLAERIETATDALVAEAIARDPSSRAAAGRDGGISARN